MQVPRSRLFQRTFLTQENRAGPFSFLYLCAFGSDKQMKSRKETLEEFVAADPDDSFSRYALALELEKEGGETDAVAQFREVIARDPDYVAAYYHLGKVLARTNHIDEAREVYRKGLIAASAANDQRTRTEIQEALDALD